MRSNILVAVLALALSGVSTAAPEKELLGAFARQARRRVEANLAGLEVNEDAALKAIAGHVLEAGKYTWDNR